MVTEQKAKFPVTLEGFGIKNYGATQGTYDVAYQVVMTYKGKDLCTLRNRGDGSKTVVYRNEGLYVYNENIRVKVHKLLCKLAQETKNILKFDKDVVLYELYIKPYLNTEQYFSADNLLEALFKLLYELNDLYAIHANTRQDSYLCAVSGAGNMLYPIMVANTRKGYFCEVINSQTLVQSLTEQCINSEVRTCNYILQVKANTRVLHLSCNDLIAAVERAKSVNELVYAATKRM